MVGVPIAAPGACAMGWPEGRSAAEDGAEETFLPREEWAKPGSPSGLPRGVVGPGEESRCGDVADQAIEAQPVFGQIKPRRGLVLARDEQHPREKTWRTSVDANKRSRRSPGH